MHKKKKDQKVTQVENYNTNSPYFVIFYFEREACLYCWFYLEGKKI